MVSLRSPAIGTSAPLGFNAAEEEHRLKLVSGGCPAAYQRDKGKLQNRNEGEGFCMGRP